MDNADQKRWIAQYLLGELSTDESAELEDAYLKDSGVFQALVTVENELIDQYILGELSSADREMFERSFLANPACREAAETSRSLLAGPGWGRCCFPHHAWRVSLVAGSQPQTRK